VIRYLLGALLTFGAINAFAGGYYGLSGAKGVPLEWLAILVALAEKIGRLLSHEHQQRNGNYRRRCSGFRPRTGHD
jgi:hypothetical protein